ncbi:hypothetical protein COV15_00335 [Candidatus Woesearchaeota archaeon CG10_big_fil_rev_8_21_14_0_10_34_12]|nr:MAG: hypothetical protein COV15_00335 [Candidatus Woesearchaeota archaeon CG10_big_fil_rev_8_21_14_0_10_34_12]
MATGYVKGVTLPEFWERAVIKTWEEGDIVPTEYDKLGDPSSRDMNILLHVTNPQQEPRIHRAFPGGLEDLEAYRLEVVEGIHDHWIPKKAYETITGIGRKKRHNLPLTETEKEALKDPNLQKWSYTYAQRIFAYDTPDGAITNQYDEALEKLVEAPHTRRAMFSLLKPWSDIFHHDPPCLNLVQFRVLGDELRMHVTMRSNDGFKAAFMNMWSFTDLQRKMAEDLSGRLKKNITPADYIQNSISFHIYGFDFSALSKFLETVKARSFEERVWDSRLDVVQGSFRDARMRELKHTGDKELPPRKKLALWKQAGADEREEYARILGRRLG